MFHIETDLDKNYRKDEFFKLVAAYSIAKDIVINSVIAVNLFFKDAHFKKMIQERLDMNDYEFVAFIAEISPVLCRTKKEILY